VTRRPAASAVSPQAPADKDTRHSALVARFECGAVGFTFGWTFEQVEYADTIWSAIPCAVSE